MGLPRLGQLPDVVEGSGAEFGAEGLAGQIVVPPDPNPDEHANRLEPNQVFCAQALDDLQPLVLRPTDLGGGDPRYQRVAPMMLETGLVNRCSSVVLSSVVQPCRSGYARTPGR